MGFKKVSDPINFRISANAFATLLYDIDDFQPSLKEKMKKKEKDKDSDKKNEETINSSFLNIIINNYYLESESALAEKENQLRENYYSWLRSYSYDMENKNNKSLVNKLISKQLEEKQKKIKNLYAPPDYGQGKNIRFKPDKKVKEILKMHEEDKYYASAGKFLSAIVQEYAKLPRLQREEIFFKETITTLTNCISVHHSVKITLYNNETWILRPYKIIPDILSSWNYVIGYAHSTIDTYTEELLPFRIQRILSLKPYREFSFSNLEESRLKKALKNGEKIPYLKYKEEEIIVQLTKNGWDLYQHRIRMNKPLFEKKEEMPDDKIRLSFKCSKTQIRNYFIKFGVDAEIIAPLELREEFADMHQTAAKYYTQS